MHSEEPKEHVLVILVRSIDDAARGSSERVEPNSSSHKSQNGNGLELCVDTETTLDEL